MSAPFGRLPVVVPTCTDDDIRDAGRARRAWTVVGLVVALIVGGGVAVADRGWPRCAAPVEIRGTLPSLGRYVPPAGPGEREMVVFAAREVRP